MLHKYVVGISLILMLISCKSEYKFILNSPNKIQINEELVISISENENKVIDSVQFSIDNIKIEGHSKSVSLKINDYKLGKHTITALLFFENKTEKVSNSIYFMADIAPEIYTYTIINTYPHDKEAYTNATQSSPNTTN